MNFCSQLVNLCFRNLWTLLFHRLCLFDTMCEPLASSDWNTCCSIDCGFCSPIVSLGAPIWRTFSFFFCEMLTCCFPHIVMSYIFCFRIVNVVSADCVRICSRNMLSCSADGQPSFVGRMWNSCCLQCVCISTGYESKAFVVADWRLFSYCGVCLLLLIVNVVFSSSVDRFPRRMND